jgi:4-(gamma-glutamylamino)butanal dehydrogenase
MVDQAHTDSVMQHIDSARREARLVCGGERVTLGSSNALVQPTEFCDLASDAWIVREEVFGPVLTI